MSRRVMVLAVGVLVGLALAAPSVAFAAVFNVSMVGSDTAGDGSTVAPYATLQCALDHTSSGDYVEIGPGIFPSNSTLSTPGVVIVGAGPGVTTLDGQRAGTVLFIEVPGGTAEVANLTIANGQGTNGGGVCVNQGAPIIAMCFVIGNSATSGGGVYASAAASPTIVADYIMNNSATFGGGVNVQADGSAVSNCYIHNNHAASGGGIYTNGDASVTRNQVTGNTVTGYGGGVDISASDATTLTENTIVGNSATYGGGVRCTYSGNTVSNNVIAANDATGYGGGLYIDNAGSAFVNDTIVGNKSPNVGAVYSSGASQELRNCIIWGNSSTVADCTFVHCDMPGVMGLPGIGNIDADPKFVDADRGDYHLAADSPCRDAATSTAAPSADLDGIARPWGLAPDMGAYEYHVARYVTSTSLSAPSSIKAGATLALTGAVSPSWVTGRVTISKSLKVGTRLKNMGTARATLTGGVFSYTFRPRVKGKWSFIAKYGSVVIGPTTYTASKSRAKTVRVR